MRNSPPVRITVVPVLPAPVLPAPVLPAPVLPAAVLPAPALLAPVLPVWCSSFQTFMELVTTVSPSQDDSRLARAHVVVPADSATAEPGFTSAAARSAMAAFASCSRSTFFSNPGSSVPYWARTAPPCTRSIRPSFCNASRLPDGHLRDRQLLAQLREPHATLRPQLLQDLLASQKGQHGALPSGPPRSTFSLALEGRS